MNMRKYLREIQKYKNSIAPVYWLTDGMENMMEIIYNLIEELFIWEKKYQLNAI